MANPIFTQVSLTDAAAETVANNASYVTAEIDDQITAVTGQIDNHFSATIPFGRTVEYAAASNKKQNDFATFSALANGPDHVGVAFVTAWEIEYAKVY